MEVNDLIGGVFLLITGLFAYGSALLVEEKNQFIRKYGRQAYFDGKRVQMDTKDTKDSNFEKKQDLRGKRGKRGKKRGLNGHNGQKGASETLDSKGFFTTGLTGHKGLLFFEKTGQTGHKGHKGQKRGKKGRS